VDTVNPFWYAETVNLVTDKPLRKDAERNRKLILDAAKELFAQRGLSVTLNEIAHHAGVGVGTVYRRFPDREKLIESLFEEKVERMVEVLETAVADPDPWHGIAYYLEQSLEAQSSDVALGDLIFDSSAGGLERIHRVRARLFPLGEKLVARAREAGELRPDVEASDLPMVLLMMSGLMDGGRTVAPDLWRRFVPIVLRGLRVDPGAPEPLPQPPLSPADVEIVMSLAKQPRR
jgi:AcrR family transcriptional regulator